jgi:predicted ATPase
LLPECERRVLRRLGFFVGAFTLDAAQSVAEEKGARESEVIDAIHSLVAKSLISIAADEGQIFYRLLETTRAFLFEKLTDSGEMEMVGKRYGLHFANAPGTNDAESLVTPKSEGFSMHAHRSG